MVTRPLFPASSSGAHRRIRKPLLIAAIITLMVFLMGCAVVCLKMEQVKIGEAAAQQDYSLMAYMWRIPTPSIPVR